MLNLLYELLPGIGDADHAARDASAGIAHRLTAVIDLRVDNHAPADDWILQAGNRYVLHRDFVVRLAVVVRLEVSQIARVPVFRLRQTVLMVFRIVVAAGAHAVGRAAIAELMNVERVLLSRSQPFNVGHNFHRVAVLGEAHGAVAFVARGRVQHRDGLFDRCPGFAVLVLGGAQGVDRGETRG